MPRSGLLRDGVSASIRAATAISSPGRTGAGQRTDWSAPPIETCATQPLRITWLNTAA